MGSKLTDPGNLRAVDLRHLLVDVLAVCLLGVTGLTPLITTFSDWTWLILGVSTVVASAALVAVFRVRAWTSWWIPLVVLGGYLVVAQVATSPRSGLNALVPGGRSLSRIARGSFFGFREVIDTLPRVEATGEALLVPVLLGVVPVVIATSLALYTTRAVLPAVPLLTGTGLSLVLGRGEVAFATLGLVVAPVVILWAADRSGRGHADPRSSPTQTAARLLLVVVALAVVSTTLGPGTVADNRRPLLLRETSAVGIDTSAMPTLLEGFRRFTRQRASQADNVHDVVLLRVDSPPRGLRLRFTTLDWYDGGGWHPNPDTSPPSSNNRYLQVGRQLDNAAQGRERTLKIAMGRGWRSNWVPMAGQLQEIGFYTPHEPRVHYNLTTATAVLPRWLKPGVEYYVTSRLPRDRLRPGMPAAQGVDPALFDQAAFVAPLADAYLRANPTPMAAFFDAARTLRRKGAFSNGGFGWQRSIPAGQSRERLGRGFLFAPQVVGNVEQYAAALALLGVRMRIPTRVVVGATVPPTGTVRGRDVDAWVEVQVADGTWRTLASDAFVGRRAPKRHAPPKRGRSTLMPPGRQIRENQQREQRRHQAQQQAQTQAQQQQPRRPREDDDGWGLTWWLLAAGAVGAVGAVPAAKLLRRNRRRRARRAAVRFAGGWQELVDAGRDLGVDVPLSLSRPRQALVLGEGGTLATLADDRTFGRAEPTLEEAERFWADVATAERALRGAYPWRRRLRAWLDPRSLWRR